MKDRWNDFEVRWSVIGMLLMGSKGFFEFEGRRGAEFICCWSHSQGCCQTRTTGHRYTLQKRTTMKSGGHTPL